MNDGDVHPNSPSRAATLRRLAQAARTIDVETLTIDDLKAIVSETEMSTQPFAQHHGRKPTSEGDSTSRLRAAFDDLAHRADTAAQELEHHERN